MLHRHDAIASSGFAREPVLQPRRIHHLDPGLCDGADIFAKKCRAAHQLPSDCNVLDSGAFRRDPARMDFGTYGGEARTRNIDALATAGAMFRQYRCSPLCSPMRAMLLTGIDDHLTGLATIPEMLPPEHKGQPGHTMALEPGVLTLGDRLRAAGYRTLMTGKFDTFLRYRSIPSASFPSVAHRRKPVEGVGLVQILVVRLADGRWMTDATPLITWLVSRQDAIQNRARRASIAPGG